MTKKREMTLCRRCGRVFKPTISRQKLCPDCPPTTNKRNKPCPICGKLIYRRNGTCRDCRWASYRPKHICPDCGKPKGINSKRCIACANTLRGGANHPMWKGGRYFNDAGYVMFYFPEHPRAQSNGYVRQHIKVWMEAHGEIPQGHVIHHLNGVKSDNRLENLSCIPKGKHQTLALINAMKSRIAELEART